MISVIFYIKTYISLYEKHHKGISDIFKLLKITKLFIHWYIATLRTFWCNNNKFLELILTLNCVRNSFIPGVLCKSISSQTASAKFWILCGMNFFDPIVSHLEWTQSFEDYFNCPSSSHLFSSFFQLLFCNENILILLNNLITISFGHLNKHLSPNVISTNEYFKFLFTSKL